jgi:hypothetical protein
MKRNSTMSHGWAKKGKMTIWQRGLSGRGELEDVEVTPREFGLLPKDTPNAKEASSVELAGDDLAQDNAEVFCGEIQETLGSSYEHFKQYKKKQDILLRSWHSIRPALCNALISLEAESDQYTCPNGTCGSEQCYQGIIDCVYFEGM